MRVGDPSSLLGDNSSDGGAADLGTVILCSVNNFAGRIYDVNIVVNVNNTPA